jgi:hypothetical protein
MVRDWQNVVRFTPPRFSLKPAPELLGEVAPAVLTEHFSTQAEKFLKTYPVEEAGLATVRGARRGGRGVAKTIVVQTVRAALEGTLSQKSARELLHRNKMVSGKRGSYKYDAVVSNGKPYFAAHGISFRSPITQQLEDSVFWMVRDVRESNPSLPIGIVALPPVEEDGEDSDEAIEQFQRAKRVLKEFETSILSEDTVESWAAKLIRNIPDADSYLA